MTARPCLAPPARSASSEETENPLVLTRSEWHSEQLATSSGRTERSISAAYPARLIAASAASNRKCIILQQVIYHSALVFNLSSGHLRFRETGGPSRREVCSDSLGLRR